MSNNEVAEYISLYEVAMSRIRRDRRIADKPACARRMVEAYFQGRIDRAIIDARLAA